MKMFRTVQLQNASGDSSGTVILANVYSVIRPQFGWYQIISCMVYGPYVALSGGSTGAGPQLILLIAS